MSEIPLTPEMVQHAQPLAATGHFGRRGVADGSYTQQVVGLLGETDFRDALGWSRPRDQGQSDGGTDLTYWVNPSIDVKTMGRNVAPRPDYVSNFQAAQAHFPTDGLVFCSLNQRAEMLTVVGWLTKQEFLQKAKFSPAGTRRTRSDGTSFALKGDLYEIENRHLHSPTSLPELACQLVVVGERKFLGEPLEGEVLSLPEAQARLQ